MDRIPSFSKKDDTWKTHTLKFDGEIRKEGLGLLENFKDDEVIFLVQMKDENNHIHWLVADYNLRIWIEFDHDKRLDNARVRITAKATAEDEMHRAKGHEMNEEIRRRILHVLGMSNYSVGLRNCEHVARYIVEGQWQSSGKRGQPLESPTTLGHSGLNEKQSRFMNSFPASISLGIPDTKFYSFVEDLFVNLRHDFYLDEEKGTVNVLVLGPSGCGKSRLISAIFNRNVCESQISLCGVTQETYFVRGRRTSNGRVIKMADTVGLDSIGKTNETVLHAIHERVDSNVRFDAVVVCFRAERLPISHLNHIKKLLHLLKYKEKPSRFQFVLTQVDHLDDDVVKKLRSEAVELLHLSKEPGGLPFEPVIGSCLSPKTTPTESMEDKVKQSVENLRRFLEREDVSEKICLPQKRHEESGDPGGVKKHENPRLDHGREQSTQKPVIQPDNSGHTPNISEKDTIRCYAIATGMEMMN